MPAYSREPSVATLVEALAEPMQADAEKNARLLEMFRPVKMAPGSGERLVSLRKEPIPRRRRFACWRCACAIGARKRNSEGADHEHDSR